MLFMVEDENSFKNLFHMHLETNTHTAFSDSWLAPSHVRRLCLFSGFLFFSFSFFEQGNLSLNK